MQKVMDQMLKKYRVIETEVFGFSSVSYNSKEDHTLLEEHPGFKLIIEVMNTNISKLEAWLHEGDLTSNRKGLLWKYLQYTDPEKMTRLQLIKRIYEWEPIVKEHEKCGQQHHIKAPPSTHTILSKYRNDKPLRDVMKQVSKADKRMNQTPSHDGSGEIYAAINPLMPHLYKMGFTFKDAETRVKALQTAGVLEPFELIRHARVPEAR
jgi:hypothetical protein